MNQDRSVDDLIKEAARKTKEASDREAEARAEREQRQNELKQIRRRFNSEVPAALKEQINDTNTKLEAHGLPKILMQEDTSSPYGVSVITSIGRNNRALHAITVLSEKDVKTTIYRGELGDSFHTAELKSFSFPLEDFKAERLVAELIEQYNRLIP